LALATGGCGERSSEVIETRDPETTFAPVVQLDPRERWRPMGAMWFLNRAVLWFAEDQGCGDRKVAVGRTLGAQRTEIADWLSPQGIGEARDPSINAAYTSNPYDARCELDFERRAIANQLTRPYDAGDRVTGLRPGEGFFIDLVDAARSGPGDSPEIVPAGVPAYVERRTEEIDDERRLSLRYWLLYGMSAPGAAEQRKGEKAHEGDWEWVEIVLDRGDGKNEYEPVAIRLPSARGQREVRWADLQLSADAGRAAATHPLLAAARGSHLLTPSRRGRSCPDCPRWRTWVALANARDQSWYGFGGAWGELGTSSATTGPLGPHGDWPPDQAR
jgi:hypothetical protein